MVKKIIIALIALLGINIVGLKNQTNIYSQDKIAGWYIVDVMPTFEGDLQQFIQKHIHYPSQAIKDSLQGKVFISFWVGIDAQTYDFEIVHGIRNDLDQEALRVVKLIKFSKPAMQGHKPVAVRYTLAVDFKIPTHTLKATKTRRW